MDKLSVAGLLVALIAIILGYALEGGVIATLFNLPALVIVLGGTVGAVMLQTSMGTFTKAMRILTWVFKAPIYDIHQGIEEIKRWASKARKNGYLSLESESLTCEDPYASKGLTLLIDGIEPRKLQDTLEVELMLERERLLDAARVFEAMGGYSPTLGILGAVLGLIQAMSFISNPELLGQGVATAFIATIYGVGLANLFFLPVANKLKQVIEDKMLFHELMAEGVLSILQGETPTNIEYKLEAYKVERHIQDGR